MNRRDFLAATMLAPLTVNSQQLFAAEGTDIKVLVIFLRGAYDACNFLVPYTSDDYYETRPRIAIAQPGSGEGAALKLNDNWGMHPAFQHTLLPLWEQKQISFIPFAGTANMSRSHFETQDFMESGQPATGSREHGSGFLNRLAAVLGAKAQPVSFTNNNPLIMQGPARVPLIALSGSGKSIYKDNQISLLEELYKNTKDQQTVAEGVANHRMMLEEFEKEKEAASRNAMNAKGFDLQVKRMATLMKDKYSLGFLDIGNWDTHFSQGGATGILATQFKNLGSGLKTFAEEMGPQWDKTVVYVMSEFGRTFRENGSGGTDHGHGSVHWLLGGAINGGKILGEQTDVNIASLNEERDYKVLNNSRDVLGGLFKQVYGLNNAQLQKVFPSSKVSAIKLV